VRYVTTRNDQGSYPALHIFKEKCGCDEGLVAPFQLAPFSGEYIQSLKDKTVNQCIAEILNHLFDCSLTSWDIDFSVGRFPVRYRAYGYRTIFVESWHNSEWHFDAMVARLKMLLSPNSAVAADWMEIAVRIAVLFGIYGELLRQGISSLDISVISGDFSVPISAWYARKMGLPINNIICCCNENNGVWDLLRNGHLDTGAVCEEGLLPEANPVVPIHLERLIFACGGAGEVERYLSCCRTGKTYHPEETLWKQMRHGMQVSVVSSSRVKPTIAGVFHTHDHILDPYTAMCYAGLQDYRVKSGSTEYGIILSERSPVYELKTVAEALGISEAELKTKI